jgi:hypothetical protein
MSFRLQSLLGVRRRQEEQAAAEVVALAGERSRAEAEQQRLDEGAEATTARVSAARLARGAGWESLSMRAVQAQAAERLRMRLGDEADRARQAASAHRAARLAAACTAEAAGRLAHRERRQAREVVEKLQARADGERRRLADRRAEDAASDLRRQRS